MKSDIMDCMEYIAPEFIAEAEEYSASERSKSHYYVIPVAAACAALIFTVNHFTATESIREPEIDNSVLNEVTETCMTYAETACVTSADFSENKPEKIQTTVTKAFSSKPESKAESSVYTPLLVSDFPLVTAAQVTKAKTSDTTAAKFTVSGIVSTETFSAVTPVTLPADTEISEYTKPETTIEKTAAMGGVVFPEETVMPADDYQYMSYSDFGYLRNDLCLISDEEPGEKLDVRIYEDINSAFSYASSAYSLNEISTESILLVKTQKNMVYRIYINRFLTDEEKNPILEKIKLLYETTV
ncbi:MAG: hypothetical protein MJ095_09590 [Oscillospiraceae bacterium]|nr:hypothetical protein [Oscillospiraceae bacterium]